MTKLHFSLFLTVFLFACGQHETPKPRGYFRIDLPEKGYTEFNSGFPYRFHYPLYAEFVPDNRIWAEPFWGDLVFDGLNARIHLSYKEVEDINNLYGYLEDAYTFVNKHIPKATAIHEESFVYENKKVFGMLFHIKGREAASPLQFYATDSTDHFLRGALYFATTPNNDSLAPVIRFIEEDVKHLLSTLEWVEN